MAKKVTETSAGTPPAEVINTTGAEAQVSKTPVTENSTTKTVNLEAKEKELAEREAVVEAREKAVAEREAEIEAKEKELAEREAAVEAREKAVAEIEAALESQSTESVEEPAEDEESVCFDFEGSEYAFSKTAPKVIRLTDDISLSQEEIAQNEDYVAMLINTPLILKK